MDSEDIEKIKKVERIDPSIIKDRAERELIFLQSLGLPSCELNALSNRVKETIKHCSVEADEANDVNEVKESDEMSVMSKMIPLNGMSEKNLRELDIKTVMLHAGCTREQAVKALIDNKGYFIGAILDVFKCRDGAILPYKDETSNGNEASNGNDDIKLVMDNTGCSEEKAVEALKKSKGDVLDALVNIDNERNYQ